MFVHKVVVEEATTGDLNFLRILTGAKIYTAKLINNYNILSFSTKEQVFECTSSWFSWSNNVPCSIACDYCIIRKIEYLLKNRSIGCFPPDLLDYVKKTETDDIVENCKDQIKIKYLKDNNIPNLICYEDLRTIQICEAHGV